MAVQGRRALGHLLAALGSICLIASLWLPWYSFQLPGSAFLLPVHVTAWQVFTVTPAVLLAVGVVGGGLSLLALTGRAAGFARVVARVGVTGTVATLYRVAAPPAQSDLLHTAWGLYLALAGGAAVLAGGLVALAGERAEN